MAKQRPPSTQPRVELQTFPLWRQNDKLAQFQSILNEHDRGVFRRSADLVKETLTDDRIRAVDDTRTAGVTSAPFTVEPAGERAIDRRLAKEIGGVDKQSGRWHQIVSQSTLGELLSWGRHMGIALAQIVWKREPRYWLPYLELWHPRWIRWDQSERSFIVQTENDQEVVLPRPDRQPRGDGRWFVWLPYGVMGWTSGLVRAMALKYMSRQWNERDWDRHNERQGFAILKGTVPSNALQEHKDEFRNDLSNIGSEPVIITPQLVDADGKPGGGYNIEAVEFEAKTYDAMEKRKAALDIDIAILMLGQNLTTEGGENGTQALGKVQNLVRLDRALVEAEIANAIRAQVLTWWSEYNYGDPELAPWPTYHVEPPEDELGEATALKTLGEAATALKTAEPRVDVTTMMDERGVPLMSDEEFNAQEEEKAAAAQEAIEAMQQEDGGEPGQSDVVAREPPAEQPT